MRYSEITPKALYLRRREFIQAATGAAVSAAAALTPRAAGAQGGGLAKLTDIRKSPFSTTEEQNDYKDITTYNNFYEFGSNKDDPSRNSKGFATRPWTVKVDGLVGKPGTYDIDSFIKPYALEERIYRLRCVEGWSMVIPWVGFPLADVIKQFEPQPAAKFVVFETLYDPRRMQGQRVPVIRYPYLDGLRMDEAMNPLAFLVVGLYGEVLPNQNGAPIRLVVPWKYGFKGIKSIVRMQFVEKQPVTTWMIDWPAAYGFYANVNPSVDHPRIIQSTERRLGEFRRRKTELFNGYGEHVAHLYKGMDLRRYY